MPPSTPARKQQQPSWAQPSTQPTDAGDFDANGNFILHQQSQNTKRKSTKKPKAKRPTRSDENEILSDPTIHTTPPQPPKFADLNGAGYFAGSASKYRNSPAISSLPIPKKAQERLLSKSLPNTSNGPSLATMIDHDDTSDNSERSHSPTPAPITTANNSKPKDSLDINMLFNIDREERKKTTEPASLTSAPPINCMATSSSSTSPAPPPTLPPPSHWANIYGIHSRAKSQDTTSPRARSSGYGYPTPTNTPPGVNTYNGYNAVGGTRSVTAPGPQAIPPIPPLPSNPNAISMPFSHKNIPASLPHHQSNAPIGYMDNTSPLTRSAGNSPAPYQQLQGSCDAPLHYGNRNLSPLFNAVKGDPRRPSNLRQQVPTDMLETPTKSFQQYLQQPTPEEFVTIRPYPLRQSSGPPAKSVSGPNDSPFNDKTKHVQAQYNMSANKQQPIPKYQNKNNNHKHNNNNNNSNNNSNNNKLSNAGANTSADDVRSMEEDLKRLLKLSAGPR